MTCQSRPNPNKKVEFIGGPIDGYRSHLTDEAHERGFALVPAYYPDPTRRFFAHYELCENGHAHFTGYGCVGMPGNHR